MTASKIMGKEITVGTLVGSRRQLFPPIKFVCDPQVVLAYNKNTKLICGIGVMSEYVVHRWMWTQKTGGNMLNWTTNFGTAEQQKHSNEMDFHV